MGFVFFIVGLVVLGLIFIISVYANLYKKAQPDIAFVRTGSGGAKVVMNGGIIFIPFLHKMTSVNLQTMRLPVLRKTRDALITGDKLRADVEAEFYIRVEPNEEKILTASRSLGSTGEVSETSVLELVGPKLVSALRSVSATKTLIKLHDNRIDFANAVHAALEQDLSENGLTLESVSISQLDASEFRQESNYFDAQGLRHITETLQSALKEKNDIEKETEIAIKEKDVTSKLTILELEKKEELAKLNQQQEIEYMRAAQQRAIEVANKEQWSETNKKDTEYEQAVIAEISVREAAAKKVEIENSRAVEEAEIEKKYKIDKSRIDANVKILEAEEEQKIKTQQVDINVLKKESEKLKSQAQKEQAAQDVITVERKAEAERNKIVEVIKAEAEAKEKEIQEKIKVDVEAYKMLQIAQAEFEASDLKAKAIERMAKADLEKALAEAKGREALVEAKNRANVNHLLMEVIGVMPEVTRELMAPAGKISDVKIFSMNGMDGSGSGGLGKTILNSGMLLPLLEEVASGKNIKDLLTNLNGFIKPVESEENELDKEPVKVSTISNLENNKPEVIMETSNPEVTG